MEWVASTTQQKIKHKYNSKEKCIGRRHLPVDGWCPATNTVYQFQGCYYHGCNCLEKQGITKNEKNGKTMEEFRQETEKNSNYIWQCGHNLVEILECEWKEKKKEPAVKQFLHWFSRPLDFQCTLTQEKVLELVKSEHLFGMVLCDIMVPEELKDYFSEMTPIFKNIKISWEDIGEPMREYAIANKLMPQPRWSLIGSYIGNKILLTTPLLKWYLEHGLVVTHVYEMVEYSPEACFKQFGESVSAACHLGDENPEHAIIASTQKLIGNSSYGKCITNKDTHHDVYYCDDQEAPKKVNEP